MTLAHAALSVGQLHRPPAPEAHMRAHTRWRSTLCATLVVAACSDGPLRPPAATSAALSAAPAAERAGGDASPF
jgi:hypothetical protein